MDKRLRHWAKYRLKYLSLLIFILGGLHGCAFLNEERAFRDKDPWYSEGQWTIVDKRNAVEIEHYWAVEGSERLVLAETLLKDVRARELTIAEAETLLGLQPVIPDDQHLYLIRAITVRRNPYPIHVYFASGEVTDRLTDGGSGKVTFEKKQFKNGVIQVVAGTHSTCMMFSPGVVRRPLVLTLQALPDRVTMYYHCDAP